MKSNVCHIQKDGEGRKEALIEAKRVAEYCGLDKKQALQLRLLAEELTGMMKAIAFDCSANFHIEAENGQFKLILTSYETLDRATRKQLIEASSTHKNEATRGIMGKIKAAFEFCLTSDSGEAVFVPSPECSNMSINELGATVLWSMEGYRGRLTEDRKKHRDEWDELEKSIIANLADNVTVSATNNHAEIIATKRFAKSAE